MILPFKKESRGSQSEARDPESFVHENFSPGESNSLPSRLHRLSSISLTVIFVNSGSCVVDHLDRGSREFNEKGEQLM